MNPITSPTALFFRLRALSACCLLAMILPAFNAPADEPATLEAEAYRRYQDLRRQFYVAVALPPARSGIRKEHQAYYRKATKLLDDIPESLAGARAAVLYRRGRVVLHCDRHERARADFEAALELFEEGAADAPDTDRLGGVPSRAELKLHHALTFENEGVAVLLNKLEDLSEDTITEHEDDVRDRLIDLAGELDRQERYRLEIRVYELIKKFELDTDEADDPDRHIAILRARLGDEAPPDAEPETDDDQNKEQ